jgi:hypothetical protein
LVGGNVNEAAKKCKKWAKPREIRLFPGDSVHLECSLANEGEETQWTHNGQIGKMDGKMERKYVYFEQFPLKNQPIESWPRVVALFC